MAKNKKFSDPILWKFDRNEKVKVKFDRVKVEKNAEGDKHIVEGVVDTVWRNGIIAGARRVGQTKIDSQGNKTKGFLYTYTVKMDDTKAMVDVEQDKIQSLGK